MEKLKYNIDIPEGFKLSRNEFYMYDPENEYTVELSDYYLQEDLLQIVHQNKGLAIDLGWYGDTDTNEGVFKIYLIKDMDWENPLQEIESKSSTFIYLKLNELVNSIK